MEGITKTKEKNDPLEPTHDPSKQPTLKVSEKSALWCQREELNLHSVAGTRP